MPPNSRRQIARRRDRAPTLKQQVAALVQRGVQPGLAVILVGDDPASRSTCATRRAPARKSACARSRSTIRRRSLEAELTATHQRAERGPGGARHPGAAAAAEAHRCARACSSRSRRPRTSTASTRNLGALLAGRPGVVPCTPLGCMRLLEHAGVQIAGKHAVVHRPLEHRRQADGACCSCKRTPPSPSAIRRRTTSAAITPQADILVAAVGPRETRHRRRWSSPAPA